MDMAVMGMKEMRKKGLLDDLEVSDEINACSIVVKADIDGRQEDWLVMFKNETHNHPTEIEPFGGRQPASEGDKGTPVGKVICIWCHEGNRKCRSQGKHRSYAARKASPKKDHHWGGCRLQLLRQSDRHCHRTGCGGL